MRGLTLSRDVPEENLQRAWQDGHADAARADCLTKEQLTRLVQRTAAASERAAAADHIGRCTACAQDYRLLRELRTWAEPSTPRTSPMFARLMWSGSLAAALVALAVGITLFPNRETTIPEDRPAAASDAGNPPAPEPANQSAAVPLVKPPVKLTPAVALRWRGASEERQPSADDLTRAFDAYRRDDFSEAAVRFEAVARRDPDVAEAHFYLGISRLFLSDRAAAIAALRRARTLAPRFFARDAAWYLSVAYAATGDRAGALAELQPLCADGQEHSVQACAAIRRMAPAR